MYDYSTHPGPGTGSGHQAGRGFDGGRGWQAGGGWHRRPGLLRMVLIGIAVAFAASFVFGALFWVLGLAFHLVGLLLRVALVTAVVAWVWRRVASRPGRGERI